MDWHIGQGLAWATVGAVAFRVRKSGTYFYGEVQEPGRPPFCIGPTGRLGAKRSCQRFETSRATQNALETWAYQNLGSQRKLVSEESAGFRLTSPRAEAAKKHAPASSQLSLLRSAVRRDR